MELRHPEDLPEDVRFRCGACGNLTRFDVETVERVRRFWHADLSGVGENEEEERLERRVESVTCRWCLSSEAIELVEVPQPIRATPPEASTDSP